jgi:hypothetical protein
MKAKLIRQLHSELHAQIDDYETKALTMVQANEKDFLNAYSAHMRKIYKDLEQMRRKISELESATYRDERVQRINNICDQFR